jgi:hypothetical protein
MNFLSITIIGANRSAGLLLGGFGMILAEREREMWAFLQLFVSQQIKNRFCLMGYDLGLVSGILFGRF